MMVEMRLPDSASTCCAVVDELIEIVSTDIQNPATRLGLATSRLNKTRPQ